MDFDSCFQLGYVIKAHGLKGEVSVLLETDQPQAYQKLESVFVEQQQRLIPFSINHLRIQGDKAVIKLDGINHVDSAVELKNHKLAQGISTEVVTTFQVYNEFSTGRQDITAIRDFARNLFNFVNM